MMVKSIARFAGTALVATAVLVAAAACVRPSAGAGPAAASASTSGAALSGATSTAAHPATHPATSPATHPAAGQSSAAGASPCAGAAIQVEVKSAGVAMNHGGDVLIFTNHGGSGCTLQGYPGVAVAQGSTTLLNATRSLSGYIGNDPGVGSPQLVTLASGKSASAIVEWVGNAGEACYPDGTGTLEVTPPNTRNTSSFGKLTLGDDGICADFEVHPVISGVQHYVTG